MTVYIGKTLNKCNKKMEGGENFLKVDYSQKSVLSYGMGFAQVGRNSDLRDFHIKFR